MTQQKEPKGGEWWWVSIDNDDPQIAYFFPIGGGRKWLVISDRDFVYLPVTPISLVTTPEANTAKDELIERLVGVMKRFENHAVPKNNWHYPLGSMQQLTQALELARAAGYGGK